MPLPSPSGALVGGRYRIERLLGRGGFGSVYVARDTRLDRPVALKLIPAAGVDDETRDRFGREARATARLRHRNVVTIHDSGEDALGLFLVLELVDGESLQERLRRGPLPVVEALGTAREILAGLEAAHALGIVHRDVKPANVLLEKDGGVKVADFGIARLLGQSGLTAERSVVGTPAYMSPEQVEGQPAGPESDLFSLGCVLYELVVGRAPFLGASHSESVARILSGRFEPLPDAVLRQAPELGGLLGGFFSRDVARRREAARALASTRASAAHHAPENGAAPKARKRRAVSVAAICLVASAAGLLAYRSLRTVRPSGPGPSVPSAAIALPDFDTFRARYWERQLGGQTRKVSLRVENGPLLEVLSEIASQADLNIVLLPTVDARSKRISARLVDVPWPVAIGTALAGTGLVPTLDQNLLVIAADDEARYSTARDALFFVESPGDASSRPRVDERVLSRLGSPAFEIIRMDAGSGVSLWQVRDQPDYLAYICQDLQATGVVTGVFEATVDGFSCAPPRLTVPGGTRALLVHLRPIAADGADLTVDVEYVGTPLESVAPDLAARAGHSLRVDQRMGTVTFRLRKVKAARAREVLLRVYGLHWNCVNGVLELFPSAAASAHRRSRRYRVEAGAEGATRLSAVLARDLTRVGEVGLEAGGVVRVTDIDEGFLRVETTLAAQSALLEAAK